MNPPYLAPAFDPDLENGIRRVLEKRIKRAAKTALNEF
jgi:hypothetical protein